LENYTEMAAGRLGHLFPSFCCACDQLPVKYCNCKAWHKIRLLKQCPIDFPVGLGPCWPGILASAPPVNVTSRPA
jgi:hypothetical protein